MAQVFALEIPVWEIVLGALVVYLALASLSPAPLSSSDPGGTDLGVCP